MEENNKSKKNLISHYELLKIIRGDYVDNPSYSRYYLKLNDLNVYIEDIPFYDDLRIEKETIAGTLFLINCNFKSITFNDCNVKHLILINTSITNDINIQKSTHEYIHVDKNSSIERFETHSSKIDFLSTKQSTISNFRIFATSHVDKLLINGCKIKELSCSKSEVILCDISESDIYLTTFTNSYIFQFETFNGSTLNGLRFTDRMIVDSITIKSGCKVSTLLFNTSHIGKVILDVAEINKVELFESHTFSLYLDNTIINRLDIQYSFIQRIQITTNKLQIAEIKHSELYALFLMSSYLPKDGYINISNTSFNILEIYSSICSGILILNNIKTIEKTEKLFNLKDGNFIKNADNSFTRKEEEKESRISFSNSDLGKAQFISCDFQLFKRFEYNNSKMLEVYVADAELPTRNNIYPFAENKTNILEQQRLALSQFKKIYENRGDNVRATQALAEEMEVYRLQLKNVDFPKPYWKSIFTKQWWNNRSERINLGLNKFSSYYGNNWLRAATTTIIIDWICFLLYSRSLGFRLGNDWDMFRKLWAYSFEFLNPLRKADFLVGKFEHCTITSSASSILIDYLSRIIIAYFVYQTIAAFRKFGKRTS